MLLVVDDEDETLLTRSMLARASDVRYTMDWAATYGEGLAGILRGDHRAYLVDHRLGTESGTELVRAARAAGSRAPLIMLTGERDRVRDLAALEAGATDFLIKGKTDTDLLDRTLRYAITQAETLQRLDRAYGQLAGLEEIGRLLLDEGPTDLAMASVAGLLADRFLIRYVAIYLRREATLNLVASRGYANPRQHIDPSDAAVERLRRAAQPLLVPSITMTAGDRQRDPGVSVELVVPLLANGALVGLLSAGSSATAPIDMADHAALRLVADRLTGSLESSIARAHGEQELSASRRERSMREATLATDSVHDPDTGLYTQAFLEAFVERPTALGDQVGSTDGLAVVIAGPADERAPAARSADAVRALAVRAASAYPGQLVARSGPSDIAILVVGGGSADVVRVAQGICTDALAGPEPLVAACVRVPDDSRPVIPSAHALLAMARRVGPGTVLS